MRIRYHRLVPAAELAEHPTVVQVGLCHCRQDEQRSAIRLSSAMIVTKRPMGAGGVKVVLRRWLGNGAVA